MSNTKKKEMAASDTNSPPPFSKSSFGFLVINSTLEGEEAVGFKVVFGLASKSQGENKTFLYQQPGLGTWAKAALALCLLSIRAQELLLFHADGQWL